MMIKKHKQHVLEDFKKDERDGYCKNKKIKTLQKVGKMVISLDFIFVQQSLFFYLKHWINSWNMKTMWS